MATHFAEEALSSGDINLAGLLHIYKLEMVQIVTDLLLVLSFLRQQRNHCQRIILAIDTRETDGSGTQSLRVIGG